MASLDVFPEQGWGNLFGTTMFVYRGYRMGVGIVRNHAAIPDPDGTVDGVQLENILKRFYIDKKEWDATA